MDSGKVISREKLKSLTQVNGEDYVKVSEVEEIFAEMIDVTKAVSDARAAIQEATAALYSVSGVTSDLQRSTGNLGETLR